MSDSSKDTNGNKQEIGPEKNKSSSDSLDASKVLKPKTRVVQSRYRNSSRPNSSNDNSKNDSDSKLSHSGNLNRTVSGSAPCLKTPGRNKTLRGTTTSQFQKPVDFKSKSTLPKAKADKDKRGRNLHSTVLAEKTLLGTSDADVFSLTLVGGLVKEKQIEKKKNLSASSDMTLPELPDISAIHLEATTDSTADYSGKDSNYESSYENFKEITSEDMKNEYMRYLQARFKNLKSDAAYEKQVKDVEAQLAFMEMLIKEKEKSVQEKKRKIQLLQYHQKSHEAYEQQKESLKNFADNVPATEAALQKLTDVLENQLHTIQLDNVYMPEPEHDKAYREKLTESIKETITTLNKLAELLESRSDQLNVSLNVLNDVYNNNERIQQYQREVVQAVRLGIQEASLLIGKKQLKNNADE